MANTRDHGLLDALVDAWDRNNTITVNLLRAIAKEDLDIQPLASSPTIAQLFAHLHYVRMIFVVENAPDIAVDMRKAEWRAERDPARLEQMLNDSAKIVREAVINRLSSGREMERHFDHPILMFQHLIWHDAYHHGQIKLTLKLTGRAVDDEEIGPLTWSVWMKKTESAM
jgi:uncharacterized damage-inducible protein DinB